MDLNDLLKKAVWEVKVEGKSYSAAARDHGISYNMLHRHANKKYISFTAGRKSVLNTNEQETLKKYVIFCLEHGYPRRRQDILDATHQILQLRLGENAKKPGKKWLAKFLKANNFTLR
jgi:transposase-like protein